MRTRILVAFLLLTLCSVGWVAAQKSDSEEKPVWTLEVIKVRPENLGGALNYLDDNWMRVRKEAKNRGAILSYRRFVDADYPLPRSSDRKAIFLFTEYKNLDAFASRNELFASIQESLPKSTPGLIKAGKPEELYDSVDMTVLLEEPDKSGTQFKLLAKP